MIDGRRGHPVLRGAAMGSAVVLALVLLGHRVIPGSAGTVTDSILPWLAAPVPALILAGVVRRRALVLASALIPALVWAVMFVPTLTDRARQGPHNLRVASLNLGSAEPAAALRPLLDARADVVVLQEVTADNRKTVRATLEPELPYRAAAGTIAVYSRLPLDGTEPVDIGIGWTRALRTTVGSGADSVRLYAAHLASARPAMTAGRDRTLTTLASAVRADDHPRLLLAGDLNTATTDRRFAVLAPLADTQEEAGAGFGFTWPARLPVLRPDHILQRGLTTRHATVVTAPGSDHRAVLADLDAAS
ncbi:endonuclease/exonuclease/phosphatase family protein [Actinoplanes sp. LDG1-06]|uniref:Endonuclease/exonuclease/phosphatase family protein n=1 Tax=Paractinoplanes ovalisporus TaxID=2810368 RepID=A0ABS2A7F0_9ACTN|nr:endonuclease/exonuclease/phosphatase family protein [Actinoplanes ovalisporus]MBM2615751.1 endonuclease/exonuclease/phosphatase family protein [Actinoplanes ovalisporus]